MTDYKIYPNVTIGPGAEIGEYVVIGCPPRGKAAGELPTVIGANAVIRSHTVIYAGNQIGDHFQSGHGAFLRECNTIGNNVSIGTRAVIEHHVEIGNGVRIHSQAFIPEYSVLEDECWIGPHVVFTNTLHPTCPAAKQCMKGPRICRRARVGANCTLLPGIVIGEDALIGAGSVVVRDVPPRGVAAGVPARVIKSIDDLRCPFDLVKNPYERTGP